MLLIEALGGGEGAPGGEAEAGVGVALQGGEVIEHGGALALLFDLELGDGGLFAGAGLDDRDGFLFSGEAGFGAGVKATGVDALPGNGLAVRRSGARGRSPA